MEKKCLSCGSDKVVQVLKIDNQPISNRFLQSADKKEYTHTITVAQCISCGLVQLVDLVPWKELVALYDWIKYNEPEKHLDSFVKELINLPDITKKSKILGVSYKEDSTLTRLVALGFNNIYRLDQKTDLGVNNPNAGIESIQGEFTADKIKDFVKKNGNYDLIIARHILEHSYHPSEFISSLKILAGQKGYIVFEVPDTAYSLENNIYTTIWEEHTIYFTPETFKRFFSFFGLKVLNFVLKK